MPKKEDEIKILIKNTEILKELTRSLDEEPLRLFNLVCKKYLTTGKAVPDFEIHHSGYIGNLSLKALAESGLIEIGTGGVYSLFQYKPTQKGLELYKKVSK